MILTPLINIIYAIYEAIIETKYIAADMPSNVSLTSGYKVNPNYKSDKVLISEVNNDNETIIVYENGNETIIAGDKEQTEINAGELPDYYNTLGSFPALH